MTVHQFSVEMMDGKIKPLADYKGSVLLIVNTATKCGLAPQFHQLQRLYESYNNGEFYVLGFPSNQFRNQEPGPNKEVTKTCQLDFGVTFPLFKKINVKGPTAHPLFKYLTNETKGFFNSQIKWNFTKFLIDQEGKVVKRYAPTTSPTKIEKDIKKLLEKDS